MTGKRGDGRHGAAGDPRTPPPDTAPLHRGRLGHETAPVAAPFVPIPSVTEEARRRLLRLGTAQLAGSDLTGRDLEAACRALSRRAYPHEGSDLAHDLHATVLYNRVRSARLERAETRSDREPPGAA